MRHRCLPLYVSADLYSQLEQAGRNEERDPIQQARYLLKRCLADHRAGTEPATDPSDRAAAVGGAK